MVRMTCVTLSNRQGQQERAQSRRSVRGSEACFGWLQPFITNIRCSWGGLAALRRFIRRRTQLLLGVTRGVEPFGGTVNGSPAGFTAGVAHRGNVPGAALTSLRTRMRQGPWVRRPGSSSSAVWQRSAVSRVLPGSSGRRPAGPSALHLYPFRRHADERGLDDLPDAGCARARAGP